MLHYLGEGVLRLQNVVERVLTQEGTQGGEGDLLDGIGDAAYLHDRALWIDDAIPDHRIDLDRHVVAGDAFLLFDVSRDRAQIELGLPFDKEPNEIEARSSRSIEFSEAENDRALVLVGYTDALNDDDGDDDRYRDPYRMRHNKIGGEHDERPGGKPPAKSPIGVGRMECSNTEVPQQGSA